MAGGCAITRLLLPRRRMLTRLYVGVSLGVLLMMWLPALWARALLFSAAAHWAAAGTLLPLVAASWLLRDRAPATRWDARDTRMLVTLLCVAVPLTALSGYLQYTHTLREAADSSLHVGQSTYGDLSLHLAVATSAVNASFPLQNSLMRYATMAYPYLSDTFASSLMVFGMPLSAAMVLTGTLMMALVYAGYTLLCGQLLRRRYGVALCALLLFLNGGLGFFYTLSGTVNETTGAVTTVWDNLRTVMTGFYKTPTNQPTPNNLRWSNILCDMLLPQRGILGGWTLLLPALNLLLPPLCARARRRPYRARSADSPADHSADAPANHSADIPADAPAYIPADVPADHSADVPANILADVPADVPAAAQADAPAMPDGFGDAHFGSLLPMEPAPAAPACLRTEPQPAPVCLRTEPQSAPVCLRAESQPAPVCPCAEPQSAPVCLRAEPQPTPTCPCAESQPAPVCLRTESQPAPVCPCDEPQPTPTCPCAESQPAPACLRTEPQPAPVCLRTESQPAPFYPYAEEEPVSSGDATDWPRGLRGWALCGLFAGALPLVHTHSFLALVLLSFGLCLYMVGTAPRGTRLSECKPFLLYAGIAAVLSLPQLLGFTFVQATGSNHFLTLQFNWCNNRGGDGLVDPYLWFYVKNIGLPFVLIGLSWFVKNRQTRLLLCGAFCIYLVAEFIRFQPNEYDNNKLFYVWFLVALPCAVELACDGFERLRGFRGRPVVAVLCLIVCFLSSALTVARECVSDYQAYSRDDVAVAEFVSESTPEHSVFLTGTQHLNPVCSLAGRDIVLGADIYLYYHGFSTGERKADVWAFYGDPAGNLALLREYGVAYIYVSPYELDNGFVDVNLDALDALFPLVYSSGSGLYRVYQVTESALEGAAEGLPHG